jgi:transcriptional regulator GlxA family with amidase domain
MTAPTSSTTPPSRGQAPPGPADRSVTRIAILVLPEATASTAYGMFDLFKSVGRDWGVIVDGVAGPGLIEPLLVARQAQPFVAANGVRIWPDCALGDCPLVDVVCIPELLVDPRGASLPTLDEEVAWLRRMHAGGAMVATACSGALLLAEAGLLDDYEATTHWAFCSLLAQRYPRVRVLPKRALVVSGEGQRLAMAGGGTTWLDLALYLIARLHGVEEAVRVARINLIDWHAIGQQPFARLSCVQHSDDALIGRCQQWLAEHYRTPAPVAAMVRFSGIPERSFKRRFQRATGMSPIEYVHTLRLEEAKQMLESGDESVEAIANEVGYEDAGYFSRLFRREVGVTPAQYRKRFGAVRRALQQPAAAPA